MSKSARHTKNTVKPVRNDWPLVVYVWIIGLGFTSYVFARLALDGQAHPLHWVFGLVGAVIGYFVGRLWYRWRGDIL